jgi:hypothetical protein
MQSNRLIIRGSNNHLRITNQAKEALARMSESDTAGTGTPGSMPKVIELAKWSPETTRFSPKTYSFRGPLQSTVPSVWVDQNGTALHADLTYQPDPLIGHSTSATRPSRAVYATIAFTSSSADLPSLL